MASRRDQLHSYQFMIQRVLSALVIRETDPAQTPLRRGTGAVFAGIMIAVILAAGFGVYGILTKTGSNNWQTENAVVVEKETGAVFVYRDKELHPVLNYASALLIGGQGPAATFQEPANSLRGTPRGVTLGIPNAPASVPPSGSAVHSAWTLCSVPGTNAAGNPQTSSRLVVGQVSSGRSVGDHAILVADDSTGITYLVWRSHRYEISDASTVIASLYGNSNATPVTVDTGWVNGLPAGIGISNVSVPDVGKPSTKVSGHANGDVLSAKTGTGTQYYLVFDDGLAPISQLQEEIISGYARVSPTEISIAQANSTPQASELRPTGSADQQPPSEPPPLLHPQSTETVCAHVKPGDSAPTVVVGATMPAGGTPTSGQGSAGTALADTVSVPPGGAVVVQAMPSSTATGGAYNLVTDVGIRYPIPSSQVLGMLGYSAADVVNIPENLVTLIPLGPTLDPAAAGRAAPVSSGNGN